MNHSSTYQKLHSTDEACEILGVGKTYLYKILKEQRLTAIKLGKLTKIPAESLQEFINSSPSYKRGA